jgi:hypothetical protein
MQQHPWVLRALADERRENVRRDVAASHARRAARQAKRRRS